MAFKLVFTPRFSTGDRSFYPSTQKHNTLKYFRTEVKAIALLLTGPFHNFGLPTPTLPHAYNR
ncbi:MAG: hypothetical protein IV298_12805 [Cylindrospermopsis raciborskii KL1]|uniref:hypothetical protein n=1 Tax=Cylindrospermopsis raciborskii TaxID=77022 RepID=UPI001A274653|nr:hypothetical protein [Cylindrospermopsis raciborskii]MBG0744346.1 hypothetical protein [Cylindrospermopsis raciborskii KL1]